MGDGDEAPDRPAAVTDLWLNCVPTGSQCEALDSDGVVIGVTDHDPGFDQPVLAAVGAMVEAEL